MGKKIRKARNKYQKTPGNSVFYTMSVFFFFFYWIVILFTQILKLDTNKKVGQCGYPAGGQG